MAYLVTRWIPMQSLVRVSREMLLRINSGLRGQIIHRIFSNSQIFKYFKTVSQNISKIHRIVANTYDKG